MPVVSEFLRNLIARQVDDNGLVVWYDPDRAYSEAVDGLDLDDTTVLCYEASFFDLRRRVEPLVGGLQPPRLVVYVPLDPSETDHALIELEAAGVVLKPGQQPPARNTRLSVIARKALKPILGPEVTASLEKQVEAGKLTLAELDALADRGGVSKGVVAIIFGTANPQEIALEFLSSDRRDIQIEKKDAKAELALLLETEFEVELPTESTLDSCRARLARHVLITDFMDRLRGGAPPELASAKMASKSATRAACVSLARTWRLRRDLRESYQTWAERVESELGLSKFRFELEQIAEVETFLGVEKALQKSVEAALLEKASQELVELARSRQSSYWSESLPQVQARWALIAVCGEALLEAERIDNELRTAAKDATLILSHYSRGEKAWCLLDTFYRHMERRFQSFDFDAEGEHRILEQLTARVRHRYMEVASAVSEKFLRCFQASGFRQTGAIRQTEVFEKKVKPALDERKVAYVWVDALRFEMARELALALESDFDVGLEAAVAAPPTVTAVGMAALLPRANESFSLVSSRRGGGLTAVVNRTPLRQHKDRVNYLADQVGVTVFQAKLDNLLPRPRRAVREGIEEAQLVLITSSEIDSLCEGENVHVARRLMDEILHDLQRGFRKLEELGVDKIIVVADHGYLFGDELSADMKIDPPGGDTVELHRRVWVGRGGAADPAYLRAPLSRFGYDTDLEIAAPWGFGCFKVQGGATAYFHGGLSLQELVIPILTLSPKERAGTPVVGQIAWTLVPGSKKISTRFFSVQIKGSVTGLFELVPPKVRVEIRANGECISAPVSASYGFEESTRDVQLRCLEDDPRVIEANTVTLMITEQITQKTARVHLFDAGTGMELAKVEKIEVDIAI